MSSAISALRSRSTSRTLPLAVGVTGLAAAFATATPALAATTAAPSAKASATAGLYGSADPTYDGAYRQSLALLGLHATGITPAPAAVSWLLSQQCGDGGWQAFRTDLSKPCAASKEDSNSTAAAVAALVAVGRSTEAAKGGAWLTTHQNADGGIGYNAGSPSDPNSTGLFAGALTALGLDPANVDRDGKTAYDALRSFQLDCSTPTPGAFFYPSGSGKPVANDLASVQAVPGLLGLGLAVPATTQTAGTTPLDCSSSSASPADRTAAADAGAAYLAKRLQDNKGVLPSGFGSGPDYSTTAQAVLALVASGSGKDASSTAVAALTKAGATWLTGPAQQGLALLLNAAEGTPSRSFGGKDVAAVLTASMRAASSSPSPSATASGSTKPTPSTKPTAGSSAPTAASTTPRHSSGTPGSATGTSTGAGPTLAATGGSGNGPLAGAGAALLAAGGALLLAARRRPSRRPAHRA